MVHAWQSRHRLQSCTEYEAEFENLVNQGYRLIDVSGYGVNGTEHYAAIWEKSPGPPWVEKHSLNPQEHQKQYEILTGQGFRPLCVSGYDTVAGARYASLWEQRQGPVFEAYHHISSAQMQAISEELKHQEFRPIDVCGYVVADQTLFTVIWEKSPIEHWDIVAI